MTTKKAAPKKHIQKRHVEKKRETSRKAVDRSNYYWLLGTIYILILFGLVMILSASSIRAFQNTGDSYYYLKKQLVSLGIGSVFLLVCYLIPIKKLQSLSKYSVYATLALLALVLIPGMGKEVDGASRWIPLGAFRLQPSEFAKIAIILYTADYVARSKGKFKHIKDLKEYGFVMGLIAGLVMLQPDMGTTIAICVTAVAMLFISGLDFRYIFGIFASGGLAGALLIYVEPYRFARWTAFLDPSKDPTGTGWQIKQSLIAFGSGGLLGVGLGMSGQKHFYLPAAHTDFIFAIIGEELGLIGTLFVLSLFAIFAYYGAKVSLSSKSRFSQMLGSGITSMIVLQAIVNMGAVTGILPVTGIPMPFISYGGSSLIVNLIAVGILMRIAKENQGVAAGKHAGSNEESSKNNIYILDEEIIEQRKKRKTKSGSTSRKKTATVRKRTSHTQEEERKKVLKLVASSSHEEKERRGARESKQSRTHRTQKRESHASNNKRGRDSGSRLSGTSSRQSSAKNRRGY
jgi:cell division protein FtsW